MHFSKKKRQETSKEDILEKIEKKAEKKKEEGYKYDYPLLREFMNIKNIPTKDLKNLEENLKDIYLEKLLSLLQGKLFDALLEAKKIINYLKALKLETNLSCNFYLHLGMIYRNLGLYEDAEDAFKKALKKEPKNSKVFFNLAANFFEMGNFEAAKNNFLKSNLKKLSKYESNLIQMDYKKGIIDGIKKGREDALKNFYPSILASPFGLDNGFFALTTSLDNFPNGIINTLVQSIECIKNSITFEIFPKLMVELQNLLYSWDYITKLQRGEYLGYLIGKYGINIFTLRGSEEISKIHKTLKKSLEIFSLNELTRSSENFQILKENGLNWNKNNILITKKIKTHSILKPYTSLNFSELYVRKMLHSANFETFRKPKNFPSYFRVRFSSQYGYMKYIHPTDEREYVIVMYPDKTNEIPNKRVPHVIHRRGRKAVDNDGNLISRYSDEAYIPLEKFIYHPKI
jgi:tetratricopeptide (TPR) repeat protein